MLRALVKNLLRSQTRAAHHAAAPGTPLRLHIGGKEPHPDWKIVNVMPGEHTDYVRSCTDLSPFPSESVTDVYASHVLEHLGYKHDFHTALREFHRVLVPGGTLRISVPDLRTLCTLFLEPALDDAQRFFVMRMMFGGQLDAADFHYVGVYEELMKSWLEQAGFTDASRVENFGLFQDSSCMIFEGRAISLNMLARKAPEDLDDA